MEQTTTPVDPVFAGIAKALYGDVDPRELLAKFSPGGSDLHMDQPLSDKEAKRQKRIAQTGLAATGVAGVAGIDATRAALKEGKHRVAEGAEGRTVGPVARQLVRMKVSPKAAGLAVGTGLLGLHAVELGADALGAHAQMKALNQANGSTPKKDQQIGKAFRLKPLNSARSRVPSLRARRPAANPLPKSPSAQGSLFKGLHSVQPPGPVTFSNAASGQTQANLAGAPSIPDPGGKHRVLNPIPAPGPPSAPSVPPTGGAGGASSPPKWGPTRGVPDPPKWGPARGAAGAAAAPKAGGIAGVGDKLAGVGDKIGAGLKAATKMPGLKPLGLVAGAGAAGLGVSSLLHRDKDNVNKGFVGNVRRTAANAEQATGHANRAAASHAAAAQKINDLIPSKKSLKRVAVGTAAGGSFAVGGAYGAGKASGRKKERRLQAQGQQPRMLAVPEPYVSKSVTWTGEIAKVDADHRQVFGWASVSEIGGKPVVDLQGDIVPIEETEKAAYRYVIESRKGGDMHRRVSKAYDQPLHTSDLIESFVVTGEKLEKMGLAPDALPHGWWVGFHVNDDAQWNLVKSGHRAGFSIHGKGVRTPAPMSKSLDDVKDKAGKKLRAVKGSLKTRTNSALHPRPVKLQEVPSVPIKAMGYQRQTRRLAVEMRSRPGRPYEYRMRPDKAIDAITASSKGSHYATKIRGKAKPAKGYTPADRVRLFVKPDVSKRSRS